MSINIEYKCFATSNYNTFTNYILDLRIKEEKLVNQSNISGFIYNSDLGKKDSNISNKSRAKSRAG